MQLIPILQICLWFDRFRDFFGKKWKERYSCNAFNLANGINVKVVAFSGVCVLFNEGTVIQGSLFNEFGITALSFSYDIKKEKIKLYSVVKLMDKWYIKKILKKDLKQLMKCLQKGESVYQDEKYYVTYSFSTLNTEELYDTEE